MADIRRMEEETKKELEEVRHKRTVDVCHCFVGFRLMPQSLRKCSFFLWCIDGETYFDVYDDDGDEEVTNT